MTYEPGYLLPDENISTLTEAVILKNCDEEMSFTYLQFFDLYPQTIEVNRGTFASYTSLDFTSVAVLQTTKDLQLTCNCRAAKHALCKHQAQVLYTILQRPEIRVFFDAPLRHEKIKPIALDYGLEHEEDLDNYFELEYTGKSVNIKPKIKELFPVGKFNGAAITENLLPVFPRPLPQVATPQENIQLVVVLAQHKYYNHLVVELYEAGVTVSGKLKKPLKAVPPLDKIWQCEKPEDLKFYTGISKFQHNYNSTEPTETDIAGLKAIINNPLQLPIFYHNPQLSAKITPTSLVPVQLKTAVTDLTLAVHVKDKFYEITGQTSLDLQVYNLQKLKLKYGYFIQVEDTLFLIPQLALSRVIQFFKQHHGKIIIHESKFEEFRESILSKLEHKIVVSYSYLKPATPQQLQETGFDTTPEKLIYLSDSEDYVTITPVVRYGQLEIPVLSKKQIHAVDSQGRLFLVARNQEAELQFSATVIKQHPDFYEQLNHDYFYLHRRQFLEESWFLEAFETWRKKDITILGFNQLRNNKLNPHKAKVAITVASGLDWFDTSIAVSYGKQKALLQHLHKSLRNKSKFVELSDGTLGILPTEWLAKFTQYFSGGEVVGESIRTPKVNFSGIADLYETHMLLPEVQNELALYKQKMANFAGIAEVPVSPELQTTLRDYQKQGLNWLNFLDGFNFGGCLADDMGLGKTIQVIAFILSQRCKDHTNTNLIVVPTSLIFNWQAEVAKFAPSINVLTIYGSDRLKKEQLFEPYEIILTSYGTLLADIKFLKNYRFNYIFLDESQAIKNPESQRYKAVRLLQSRNKVVLTGTPIENNTFDLYGQLSFACPGLLGNKQFFKAHYATPIDKFKDSKRAQELQKKIKPFILRRTKEQVARELPDKTEMVIYCEMGAEQRQVYDTYAREIREYLLSSPEDNLPKNSMQVLQGLTKLRQICNSPALLPDEKYYGNASAKIETLLEQIESKAPHHKILVFSQFVTMLELIKKELIDRDISFEYLTGQTRDRATRVNQFQRDDSVRVFLISLKAGGTGLNLTRADYVYLVDPWWNPAVENQAIDRVHRIGQQKQVIAIRLICPNTIEEKIRVLQASKMELAKDLIKTDAALLKSLSRQDILNLFT